MIDLMENKWFLILAIILGSVFFFMVLGTAIVNNKIIYWVESGIALVIIFFLIGELKKVLKDQAKK